MGNMQTYDQFVASGMKSEGIRNIGRPRRIGSQRPLFGRHGKPGHLLGPPSKPKPKPDRPVCVDKVNEKGRYNLGDGDFDMARFYLDGLSKYLEMPEKDLCELIYNGYLDWSNPYDKEEVINGIKIPNEEKINALAYSYGLI